MPFALSAVRIDEAVQKVLVTSVHAWPKPTATLYPDRDRRDFEQNFARPAP
jgi:hypothetical protein